MTTSEEHRRFVDDCCDALEIRLDELMGKRKNLERVVQARKAVAWALRQRFPGLSYPKIGAIVGRDHSTVMYSVNEFTLALDSGAEWAIRAAAAVSGFQRPMAGLETPLESLRYCGATESRVDVLELALG